MAKLILMVGNIGTGKTTTTNELMANASYKDNRNTIMISVDDLALALNNGCYGPDIWTDKHWPLYAIIKQHIVREAFIHGFDIIVDGTHMSKINRKAYIDIAKEFGASVTVYLHTYTNGLKRRIAEPKSKDHDIPEVWAEVYNKFANMYEAPTLDEDIDAIIKIKGE